MTLFPRFLSAALALALITLGFGALSTVHAGPQGGMMAMPKPVTIEGTLVDSKCYSMNAMNSGNDHMTPKGEVKACATACASMGIPVGVLDKKGALTIVIAPANLFASHMTKTARVTGAPAVDGHGVIADKVEVKEADGSWKDVPVVTMM